MANDLQYFSPEIWSNRIQATLKNQLVGAAIANTEERAVLSYGDRVHRPYHSRIPVQTYTKGGAITMSDVSTTDEYLDVDQAKLAGFYLDDIDKIQNKYNTMDKLTVETGYQVSNLIDRNVLGQVANFSLGNTTASSLSTTNIVEAFSTAKASLFNNGAEENKEWYTVIDGDTAALIEQATLFNGFQKADSVLEKGWGLNMYMGKYLGLNVFKSQNLPTSAVLGIATQPTDGDTVSINGITFTFKTTLGSTAKNVLIGASADEANANLTAAINGAAGAGSTYVALSTADRTALTNRGVTATSDTSGNTITVTAAGKMVLAKTLTATADGWATQTMKMPVGVMGNIDLVIQSNVNTVFKDVDDKLGKNVITWALYGYKTFVEGAQRGYALYINK